MSYTNGYDDGYKKGYKDGFENQSRSSTGGFNVKEVARCCVSPETYMTTFTQGYNRGYDDGIFLYFQQVTLKKENEKKQSN